MCFYFQQSKDATALKKRFKANYSNDKNSVIGNFNGFSFPKTPIISNQNPDEIDLYQWGLIPHWAKDSSINKFTLNARIETIKEKPSFRTSIKNRCLIIADAFNEWQWLDEKGKKKQKYEIGINHNDSFAFAGLWSSWTNVDNGEIIHSYTILTTEANELMSKIHNSKKRMPVIVENELDWLMGDELIMKNDKLQVLQ
jgi:putative SOS response-associated peptidase YedK